MLSRVANSIYWMQRYRERAENIARLIDVNLYLNIDAPGNDEQQWQPTVVTTGDHALFQELHGKPTQENVLEFLTFDPRNPNSILNCLYHSRENARSIRESITYEMWHELNLIYLFVRDVATSGRRKIKSLFDFYSHIRRSCQLFTGVMDTSLSHDEAWYFGRIGNLLERADQSSRILDVKYFILLPSVEYVGTPYDDILWAALLKSVSGLEMYRKLYHGIHHSHVVEFIILNREFPRSIHSCLYRTLQSLKAIHTLNGEKESSEALMLVEQFVHDLESTSVYDIVKRGMHEFLEEIQLKISNVNNSIYNTYFAPLPENAIYEPAGYQLQSGRTE